MDEQRCSAPEVLKNLCTPSPQRKDFTLDTADKPDQEPVFLKADKQWQVRWTSIQYTYRI